MDFTRPSESAYVVFDDADVGFIVPYYTKYFVFLTSATGCIGTFNLPAATYLRSNKGISNATLVHHLMQPFHSHILFCTISSALYHLAT